MEWFDGDVRDAVSTSKSKQAIFMVYISGEDDISKKMNSEWENQTVIDAVKKANCVCIRLEANSVPCTQFSAIYPVVCIPSTFFIGITGAPLEIIGGHQEATALKETIEKVAKVHQEQVSKANSPPTVQAEPSSAQEATASQPQNQPTDVSSGEAVKSSPSLEEKIARAQELTAQKREEKAQEEFEKQKQQEIERRKLGQGLGKLRQYKEEQEMKEIKDQLRKDKEEDRKARERVKEQIARDRAERNARFQKEKAAQEEVKLQKQAAKDAANQQQATLDAENRRKIARIQFRLPDGSSVTNQFPSDANLSEASQYLRSQRPELGAFTLGTNYPKRDFVDSDMEKSLLELELAPSAAIVVIPGNTTRASLNKAEDNSKGFLMLILAPFLAFWNMIMTFLFAKPNRAVAPPGSSTEQPSTSQNQRSPDQSRGTRPKTSYGVRKRKEGNITRFSAEDGEDDSATWNGNSTQQM